MVKIECDIKNLIDGRKKQHWWGSYESEWSRAERTEEHGVYATKFVNWVCICPAYRRSSLLLCKHLIKGRTCPTYRDFERFRVVPFMMFRRAGGRFSANIDHELGPDGLKTHEEGKHNGYNGPTGDEDNRN